MSSNTYLPYNNLLKKDQALIPQTYKKSLQSRALLDHYQESQMRKIIDQREAISQKMREMEFSKIQSERHQREMERKRMIKENTRNQYSKEYEQMIEERKQKQKYQKQKQLWLEQKMLEEKNWLLDTNQQKQIEKMKKIEYGKQLEKHLKIQEQRRISEANKIKQIRQKLKRQAQQAARKEQYEQYMKYNRKSMGEYRQLGVKDALNWSNNDIRHNEDNASSLTPRMDRMLKVQHQKYYDKGIQAQYKSENQKRYFQKQNPEQSYEKQMAYNPITNPIPYKYKNPNVLKLLSDYS